MTSSRVKPIDANSPTMTSKGISSFCICGGEGGGGGGDGYGFGRDWGPERGGGGGGG